MAFLKRDPINGGYDVPVEAFRRGSDPKYTVLYCAPPHWGLPVAELPELPHVAYEDDIVRPIQWTHRNFFDPATCVLPAHTGVVLIFDSLDDNDRPIPLACYQFGELISSEEGAEIIHSINAKLGRSPAPGQFGSMGPYVETPGSGIMPLKKMTHAVFSCDPPERRRLIWSSHIKGNDLKLRF